MGEWKSRASPGLKGKVVHYVDTAFEEDNLYIHVRLEEARNYGKVGPAELGNAPGVLA